jgi:hypothetical protein
MTDGEDYIYRPVLRGLVRIESLLDGTVGLLTVAKLNEALDVENENHNRMRSAQNG